MHIRDGFAFVFPEERESRGGEVAKEGGRINAGFEGN